MEAKEDEIKKAYVSGYNAAFIDILYGNEDIKEYLDIFDVEFIPCYICGKPLQGFVIRKSRAGDKIKELARSGKWRHASCQNYNEFKKTIRTLRGNTPWSRKDPEQV